MGREGLLMEARRLLRRAINARFESSLQVEKERKLAYADGYVRALLDAEIVDQDQVLRLIGEERVMTARGESAPVLAG